MSIRSSVALALLSAAKAVSGRNSNSVTVIPQQYAGYGDRGISASISYSTLVAAYKSWVYIAVDKIARTVASLPVNVYTYKNSTGKYIRGQNIKAAMRGIETKAGKQRWLKSHGIEKVLVENSPVLDLFTHPNRLDTRFMLWYNTMVKLELSGAVGWYLPPNALGLPAEIITLPLTSSASLRPIPDQQQIVSGFVYQDGNTKHTFTMDELLWIRYPNPSTPYEGMSALKAQTYPYDIDDYLQKYQYYMLKNKATPGMTLSTDVRLKDAQVAELINEIQTQWAGVKNAGNPLVLHSGLKEGGRVSRGFDELEVQNVEQAAQDKMLAAYGTPAGKLGLVKDVNRANMEALDKTFNMESIKPRLMMIEEVIERDLLPRYDDRLQLDFDIPDSEDREHKIKLREANLRNGYTTINEERAEDGLEPVPWGEEPWLPAGLVQPGDSASVAPPAEPKSLQQLEVKAAERRVEGNAKPFAVAMKKVFRTQRKKILEQLDKVGGEFKGNTAGWSLKKVREHLSRKALPLVAINLDEDEEVAALAKTLAPLYTSACADAGQARLDQLLQVKAAAMVFEFDVSDPRVDAWINERGLEQAKGITETTMKKVGAVLRDGLNEGLPLTTIAETITETFRGWEHTRANTVAWTESHAADTFADLEAVQQSGMSDRLRKTWLAANDGHVRDSHVQAMLAYADGIPIGQDFVVGEDTMAAPGLGSVAAENCNCRCTVAYVKA